jgi:hypothetical protein
MKKQHSKTHAISVFLNHSLPRPNMEKIPEVSHIKRMGRCPFQAKKADVVYATSAFLAQISMFFLS